MSSPFPAPNITTTAAQQQTVVTVTHTAVVERAVEVPVPVMSWEWLAVVGAMALFGGLVAGFLLARWLFLARLDPIARAFAEGREIALVVGRDLRLRAYRLMRLNPQFAVSPESNAYMVISEDTKPLVTESGKTVWIGLDLGRMFVPWGVKYDHYNELCMAAVLPRECDSLDSPECWEKLAKATGELGGWMTFVGPLKIMVSVPSTRFLALLGHKTVHMLASLGLRLEALSLSMTKSDVLKWFATSLQTTIHRYWVYIIIVVIIAIMGMAILSVL